MKKRFSVTFMSFMLVLQVLSSGFLMPMSAFAATNGNQTSTQSQNGVETNNTDTKNVVTTQKVDDNKVVEDAKQAVESLFTNNQYTALAKAVTEWRINTVEITVDKVTDDQVKKDLQDKIELAKAFLAVNALFTANHQDLASGISEDSISKANDTVTALKASSGKNVLLDLVKKASSLLEDSKKKEKTKATKVNVSQKIQTIDNKDTSKSNKLKVLSVDDTGTKIGENILSDMSIMINGLKYTSTPGTPVELPKMPNNSNVTIAFKYKVNEGSIRANDYFEFKLPQNFIIAADGTADLNGNGSFTYKTDGTVRLTFNKTAADLTEDPQGEVGFSTTLKADELSGADQKIVVKPVNEEYQFNAHFEAPTPTTSDYKKGSLLPSDFSPTGASWEFVVNSSNKHLTDGVIEDTLPVGMTVDPSSVAVYSLKLLMNGQLEETKITPIIDYSLTSPQIMTIKVGDTSLGYKVKYNTTVDSTNTATKFTNAVVLKDGIVDISKPNPVTLNAIVKDTFVKNDGSLSNDQKSINWKIEFNADQKAYNVGLKLKDTVENGSEFMPDSLEIEKANLDANGNVIGTGAKLAKGTDYEASSGGVITFKIPIKNTPYIITYSTTVPQNVSGSGNGTSVKNTIGFNDTASNGTVTDSGTISRGATTVEKLHGNPNYSTKTVPWTITANTQDNYIQNAKFKDTLGDNLSFSDSLNLVVKDGNNELTEVTDYTKSLKDNVITITLKKPTKNKVTISYDTKFAVVSGNKDYTYNNTVGLSYTDQYDVSRTVSDVPANFKPDTSTVANGYKSGKYQLSDKTVDWRIGINYNLTKINKPVVVDKLTQDDNHKYSIVENSLKVCKLEGVTSAKDNCEDIGSDNYSVNYDTDKKGFTLTFTKEITEAYEILYTTKDDEEGITPSTAYENTAEIRETDPNDATSTTLLTTLKGKSDNPNNYLGKYVNKTGSQDGNNKKMNWTIMLNQSQSVINDAILTDIPKNGYQLAIEDTIKVIEQNVGTNGDFSDGKVLEKGTDYEVTLNDNTGGFELKFKHLINKAYKVTYSSFFNPGTSSQGNISNSAKLTGSSFEQNNTEDLTSQNYMTTIAWGTSNVDPTKTGSLEITKVDRNDSSKVLKEATFSLYADKEKTVKVATKTTEDGKVTFNRLVQNSYYYLVEDTAPSEYEKNNVQRVRATGSLTTINIDDVEVGKACPEYKIQYNVPTGITVNMEQVEFNIYEGKKKLNTEPLSVNEDGSLEGVPILEKGKTYKVIQISGIPNGYDPVAQNISVDKDCTNNLVTITNKSKTTCSKQTIQVKKEDNTDLSNYTAIFTKLDGSETKSVTTTDSKVTVPEGFNEGTYTVTIQGIGLTVEDVEPTFDNDCNFVVKISDSDKCEQQIIKVVDKYGKSITDETFIKNSTFELVEKNSNEKYENLVIDEHGQLGSVTADGTFKALTSIKEGTYKLVQTTAPVGYKPVTSDVVFDGTKCLAKVIIDLTNPGAVCDQFDITVVGTDKTKAIVDIKFYDQFVSGSKFKLVDQKGNIMKSGEIELNDLTINSKGKIVKVVDESEKVVGTDLSIHPGSYKLVQTKTPEGFIALSKDIVVYQQDNGCNAIVQIDTDNHELKCDISADFEVVGVTGQQATDLANQAEFKVIDNDGKDVTGATGLKVEDGKVKVPDLSPGTYKLVQTKAPAGYYAASPQTFVVSTDTCTKLVAVKNYQIPSTSTPTPTCPIEFNVVDSKTNNGIGNATFEVKQNGATVATATSDAAGKVALPALPVGDYQLVQTSSKAGYDFSKEPIPFSVKNDNGTCSVTISTVKNDPKTCPVNVTVIDADDTNVNVAGATFTIKDKDGKVVAENVTSDKDGKIIVQGLVAGDYTLVQTSVPNGYTKSADVSFTVKAKEDGSCDNTVVVVKDVPKQCDVVFINKDEKTGKVVQGSSTFIVKDKDNKTITTVTSDSNGKITVSDLKPGTYQLVQQKAPSGYEEQSGTITFTVKKGECAPIITIENKKTSKTEDPTNNNNNGNGKDNHTDNGKNSHTDNGKNNTPNKNNGESTHNGTKHSTYHVTDKKHASNHKNDVYKLVDKHGNAVASGLKVNKDGNIVVNGLPDGEYHLVKLPQTGVQSSVFASLMGIILLVLGGYAVYLGRKKKMI